LNLLSKEELINSITTIANNGWHKSVKNSKDTRNDGAVGNTLEQLLGIDENNLPIPNAREWELKGQRLHTSSLVTLKHMEPSPTATRIVSRLLLPKYGWKHKQAGKKYPDDEMSFRSTTGAISYTNRGFRIIVDRENKKVRFVFDYSKADASDEKIKPWLADVENRIGTGPLNPEPYWGFEDLKFAVGTKLKNCFYVIAESKLIDKHEYFRYDSLYMLSDFSFDKFLSCLEEGVVLIDFDARTKHNHGTKFRLKQGSWNKVYNEVKKIF
jgi:hypothetical protein